MAKNNELREGSYYEWSSRQKSNFCLILQARRDLNRDSKIKKLPSISWKKKQNIVRKFKNDKLRYAIKKKLDKEIKEIRCSCGPYSSNIKNITP